MDLGSGIRVRHLVAIATVACAVLILSGCNRESGSRAEAHSIEAPAPTHAVQQKPDLPLCPPGNSEQTKGSSPATRDHKVILSWNANAPSAGYEGDVGYCIYRSKSHPVHDAGQKMTRTLSTPPCKNCDQVTPVPIVGTGCVDDSPIINGARYYYVAIAIEAGHTPSGFSKTAVADIPKTPTPLNPTISTSYPSCNVQPAPKQGPGAP